MHETYKNILNPVRAKSVHLLEKSLNFRSFDIMLVFRSVQRVFPLRHDAIKTFVRRKEISASKRCPKQEVHFYYQYFHVDVFPFIFVTKSKESSLSSKCSCFFPSILFELVTFDQTDLLLPLMNLSAIFANIISISFFPSSTPIFGSTSRGHVWIEWRALSYSFKIEESFYFLNYPLE